MSPLVLLVQLPIPPPGPQPVRGNVPLAAAYLKLFAERRGLQDAYRIELLPATVANTLGDQGLVAEILDRRPWMVGFTCYVWNIDRTLWIVERLRQARPDLRIVLGGPEITADNEWVLGGRDVRACTLDYAVLGEGEQTFAELLTALRNQGSMQAIPGLWTPGGRLPARRDPLADLDAISSPYLAGILDPGDERTMLLETARGCRFRCKYCYYAKSYSRLCFLSPEAVAANLRYANEQGVSEVVLLDPTLNQRPGFADFLRLLARGNPHRQFTYSAELRAEGIDAPTARLLREANFQEVEAGLQSVDPHAQRLMGREVDLAAFQRGARAMLDEGIRVRVDLILGLPGDTVDSVRRGIEFLGRTKPFSELQVFNLSVLPGTAFRDEAASLGLEYQQRPPYYVFKTPALDAGDLYVLMDEAQRAFGIEFDALGPPVLAARALAPRVPRLSPTCSLAGEPDSTAAGGAEGTPAAHVDLDRGPFVLPPPAERAQAFTLWLRSADFDARRQRATELVVQVLADNPHTTLQVVLEPSAELHRLSLHTLEALLAACHRTLSYLDWYHSLRPGGRMGAKRLVVLAPWSERAAVGQEWIEAVGECAALVWRGAPEDDESLAEHEYADDPASVESG